MIHLHILNRNALWSAYGTQVVDDDIWGLSQYGAESDRAGKVIKIFVAGF